MVLVDTSVWIEVFRRPSGIRLEDAVDLDEIVTCLPVTQEVLQGFRDERAFGLAREAMTSIPVVESPLSAAVFDDAAGLTVRSSVDCLVAACALRHGLTVLHCDRDYAALARVSPLRSRALKAVR